LATLLIFSSMSVLAQLNSSSGDKITYAIPFVLVSTDARTSAMGDAGAAILPLPTSVGVCLAKNAFLEDKAGFNMTYTPWLTQLIKDRRLMNLDGYYKISKSATLTGSLSYLSYGQFDLIDDNKFSKGSINPAEYVGALGVSKSFGASFALGTNIKYIHSNLYSASEGTAAVQSGNAFAVDISSFHRAEVWLFNKPSHLAFSLNILNIGPKMAYYFNSEQRYFLPTTLKIGSSLSFGDKDENELNIAFDVLKMLVPSQFAGAEQPSVLKGILSSFSDSKDGFTGELKEVGISIGAEYIYKRNIAFRGGYNYRNTITGVGSFLSVGFGFKYKQAAFDLSYVTGNTQNAFLSDTLRFTLGYSIPN